MCTCILPGKAIRKMTYIVSVGMLNLSHSLIRKLRGSLALWGRKLATFCTVSFFSPIFAGADHKSSQKVFRNSGRARAGIIWDNVCPIIDSSWSFASHTGGSQGGGGLPSLWYAMTNMNIYAILKQHVKYEMEMFWNKHTMLDPHFCMIAKMPSVLGSFPLTFWPRALPLVPTGA